MYILVTINMVGSMKYLLKQYICFVFNVRHSHVLCIREMDEYKITLFFIAELNRIYLTAVNVGF